jgi:hypothetical protein
MMDFHIATIYNQKDQYVALLETLKTAGFTEMNSRFSGFDNTSANQFDPYRTINDVLDATEEKYVLFCHQDVRFDQGDGYSSLKDRLMDLDRIDSRWAVAGNAGVNSRYQIVVRITDPNRSPNWSGQFPQQVFSLDENLLIFKTGTRVRCTPSLSGFHFYGPDVCLSARQSGNTCYVINYHVSHLSGGSASDDFRLSMARFSEYWSSHFAFLMLKTVTNRILCLSRFQLLRSIGSWRWVQKALIKLSLV